MSYYTTSEWRRLSGQTKKRDHYQCQICGDRKGDPHTILNAHHLIPRADGGPNTLENLITLCDLCHAVVTPRWEKPWFGSVEDRSGLPAIRQEYLDFLALVPEERTQRQTAIWQMFGIAKA